MKLNYIYFTSELDYFRPIYYAKERREMRRSFSVTTRNERDYC